MRQIDLRSMPRGQKIALMIALYMCVKPVFNWLVLGGQLMPLALGFAAVACFLFGLKKTNLVFAVLLMLVACANLPTNLKNIGFNQYLVYTFEGVMDMAAACALAFMQEVREFFGSGGGN